MLVKHLLTALASAYVFVALSSILREPDFMKVALEAARVFEGQTRPNPPVGAVLVDREGRYAVGSHAGAGKPHAEVEAVAAAEAAGIQIKGASLFVTLEPCSRHGKTPPCSDCETQEMTSCSFGLKGLGASGYLHTRSDTGVV